MTKLTALFLICLTSTVLSSEPVPFTISTKKLSHVLDDHFISITINPTDLLQGKVYGLQMNSTMAILKGLAPAYVRIGSADTAKYTFKRNRYPSDVVKPDDEYTVTETHWMVFNEVVKQAGLDVIVCLNAAHRTEGTKKWDQRNSLELISFSDSQGYNLTWQLGYEVQGADDLSGIQFGKDLNRLRTILNAFPRYQQAKLIGPDIRVIHKKEDIDFWNDVLVEAGPTLDAVTWHPRWPQPSKMKVSDNSELGYEFPIDYLEWDKAQLNKILQKSVFKNPIWIGETKRESTGTFAEGLIWARRLVLAAKSGIEVVMKQPNLMDITHPKPEYWIALLHKKLLGRSVLETRSVGNNTELTIISHCTNPFYWSDKPEKLQDGAVTVYGVNVGGLEQKIQIKGTWTGKSQLLFQYVLTSGSDPDSVFSQMTYLNGEPLMMTDDGLLPDIIPKVKKLERGLTMKLPPYSVGFWVVPEAKVKLCQLQAQNIPTINIDTLTPSNTLKFPPKKLENIQDINQFMVEKLKNPESESEEIPPLKIEVISSESSEKDLSKENNLPRVARRIRQVSNMDEINQQIKTIMQETQEFLSAPDDVKNLHLKPKISKANPSMEKTLQGLAEGISDAIKFTNQQKEFNKFLEDSGLKQDFGSLIMNDRRFNAPGMKNFQPFFHSQNPDGLLDEFDVKERLRRSISESEEYSQENAKNEEEIALPMTGFNKKISLVLKDDEENKKQDLVIPHQPDLKGLEEKYKAIVHSKIQDGKRKIDNIKRKIMQDDTEINQKIVTPETVNAIQEEIIKKEIELLEKTEETVADILKTQKKRQETFEDIILDELSDVKEERVRELEEMQKNQGKNSIVKRQTPTPLSKPLLKTIEHIEKNLNLEPESVRKIKRSLEERMGEILRSYDTKKALEVKKRMVPLTEERKTLRKSVKETDKKAEQTETKHRSERNEEIDDQKQTRERPKEKNVIKKLTTSQSHSKSVKKPHGESSSRSRKSEETKKPYEDSNDSFELFNEKKLPESAKKSERRRSTEVVEEKKASRKISSKTVQKEAVSEEKKEEKNNKETEQKQVKEVKEGSKVEQAVEESPLKNDKERRANMLKQITLIVDKMTSEERGDSRSHKRKADEDISEEFESDRRPRGIRRRPRRAEMIEELTGKKEQNDAEETMAEADIKPTTPASKLAKLRKRIRPIRKHKDVKKVTNEEITDPQQKKRHLPGFDRSFLELEKKKLIKPKIRKLNPKYHSHGNELLINEKPELVKIPIQEEVQKKTDDAGEMVETIKQEERILEESQKSENPTPVVLNSNEELKKDLEEIVEEKIFLEQGSVNSKEKLEISGRVNSKPKEMEITFSEETSAPTEGYIIVDPTEETESEEAATKKTLVSIDDTMSNQKKTENTESVRNNVETSETDTKNIKKNVASEEKENENLPEDEDGKDILKITQIKQILEEKENKNSGEDTDNTSTSPSLEDIELKDEEIIGDATPLNTGNSSQRKRRATFLTHRNVEEDEEDYSSEERIQKFKQMIYRNSPSKKPLKNEVRSNSGMGMGADEFLRMAGSTVRVMFDDVIPEAYGQTKNKIQNMGITQYIKEFGNIVQQMKNLDQIFLNIGEAAVKGYIKGNKAEKGPYIQVISRKKREVKKEGSLMPNSETDTSSELGMTHPEMDQTHSDTDLSLNKPVEVDQTTDGSIEYATTSTDQTIPATGPLSNREDPWDLSTVRGESRKSIHEDDKTFGVETTESAYITEKKIETEEAPEDYEKGEDPESVSMENSKDKDESPTHMKPFHKIPKTQARKKLDFPNLQTMLKENGVGKKVSAFVPEDLQEKIFSPWIKTTKDFIQQAITTLQRQRELSEILANDLMNREITKRAIGKREVGDEDPKLPVYHMIPPSGNKKREVEPKQSDERLIRHLRGLQPGVYVVPTEEMTNIRSEQITNEAKQKSGMPNVVTLNIYYDKKSADGTTKDDSTGPTEAKVTQDAVTYYQNKAWNAAAGQYNQNGQYLTVPEVNIPTPVVSPLQVNPALQTQPLFTAEHRVAELPNSRLIQYSNPTYHYPPLQKMYPAIVPNPPVYGPVYYLPQENRYASQPPGTKRQWREFKARSSGVPLSSSINTGWNIEYDVPASMKGSAKSILPSSYNKNYKVMIQDKKRSIGDSKIDPTWSETALPFWKFFSVSENKDKKVESESKALSVEKESSEDVFAENRKRAKAAIEKKGKTNSIEQIIDEKDPDDEEEEESVGERQEDKTENKSRKRRSIDNLAGETERRQVHKRSHPYTVEFRDHDILPEWFGTYQEVQNALDGFPPHVRRSHIISTPWSEEDEELLTLLEADDELSLVDLNDDDDYYYSNDNHIQHVRRYPRSTDQFDSNMIKTNMIYKMPMDGNHLKPKVLGMMGVKKLTDGDSSLEMVTKSRLAETKATVPEEPKTKEVPVKQQQPSEKPEEATISPGKLTTVESPSNGTTLLPRNPHDDTFYYFFKYAYDSFVKVMKSMTEFF